MISSAILPVLSNGVAVAGLRALSVELVLIIP